MATLADLTKPDGTPTGDNYFYDSEAGMLFFYVQQESKNAHGKMPFGSCPQDAACPDENELDTYFPCPPQGCVVYSVNVDPQKYTPAPNVTPFMPAQIAKYEQAPPQNQNRLAYVNADGSIGDIVDSNPTMSSKNFLHWTQKKGEFCPNDVPAKKTLEAGVQGISNLTWRRVQLRPGRYGSAGSPPTETAGGDETGDGWTGLCRCAVQRNEATKATSLGSFGKGSAQHCLFSIAAAYRNPFMTARRHDRASWRALVPAWPSTPY